MKLSDYNKDRKSFLDNLPQVTDAWSNGGTVWDWMLIKGKLWRERKTFERNATKAANKAAEKAIQESAKKRAMDTIKKIGKKALKAAL